LLEKARNQKRRHGVVYSLLILNADHFKNINCVTVSIGVAQHQSEETTESLLRRADTALYQAKASGRNRVVVS